MLIIPALLTTYLAEFERQLVRLLPYYTTFQIDVQDGKYVPSLTLSVEDLYIFFSSADQAKLALYQSVIFDFHLMEQNYAKSITTLQKLSQIINIRYVFVHTNFNTVAYPESGENCKFQICPVFSPEDTVSNHVVGRDLLSFPAIQIMTIHPGPQGQSFLVDELGKVDKLQTLGFKGLVMIDGSVNEDSITQILSLPQSFQPDVLCVGSNLSRCPDENIRAHYMKLNQLISQ